MIRELLSADSQGDPYSWASVLLAHAWIGCAGFIAIGWYCIPVYIAFEIIQAAVSRRALVWDCILDACAVCCGALMVYLWVTSHVLLAVFCICVVLCIAAVGWAQRSGVFRDRVERA